MGVVLSSKGKWVAKKEEKKGKPVTLGAMGSYGLFHIEPRSGKIWHCHVCRSHARGLHKFIVFVDGFALINRFLA